MNYRDPDALRILAVHAQAAKQADLNLFYRIMSAESDALYTECTQLGLSADGLTQDEIRRTLLAHYRSRRSATHDQRLTGTGFTV